MRPYSDAVKADVRRRMSPPNRQSVVEIARELGVARRTVYRWVATVSGVNYLVRLTTITLAGFD